MKVCEYQWEQEFEGRPFEKVLCGKNELVFGDKGKICKTKRESRESREAGRQEAQAKKETQVCRQEGQTRPHVKATNRYI